MIRSQEHWHAILGETWERTPLFLETCTRGMQAGKAHQEKVGLIVCVLLKTCILLLHVTDALVLPTKEKGAQCIAGPAVVYLVRRLLQIQIHQAHAHSQQPQIVLLLPNWDCAIGRAARDSLRILRQEAGRQIVEAVNMCHQSLQCGLRPLIWAHAQHIFQEIFGLGVRFEFPVEADLQTASFTLLIALA